jgi:hypothetical protein
MVLVVAHYFPFAFLCEMRVFLFPAGILIGAGVVVAHHVSGRSVSAHGLRDSPPFVFAWTGPISTAEDPAASSR